MAVTDGSTPRGLREADAEDQRFSRFFSVIQDAASRLGCVFFVWAGEGHELVTSTMDGEDLSGWLVPNDQADEFERQWARGLKAIDAKFDGYDTFARWSYGQDGSVSIRFGD